MNCIPHPDITEEIRDSLVAFIAVVDRSLDSVIVPAPLSIPTPQVPQRSVERRRVIMEMHRRHPSPRSIEQEQLNKLVALVFSSARERLAQNFMLYGNAVLGRPFV